MFDLSSNLHNQLNIDELQPQLAQWQQFFNQERTHSALSCRTPQQRLEELKPLLPTAENIYNQYRPHQERYITNNRFHWVKAEADSTHETSL